MAFEIHGPSSESRDSLFNRLDSNEKVLGQNIKGPYPLLNALGRAAHAHFNH